MNEKTKQCTKCEKEKPLNAFQRNRNNADGRMYVCKTCRAAYDKQRDATPARKIHHALLGANKRAEALGLSGRLTAVHIIQMYLQQNGRCYWTNEEINLSKSSWSIDHVVPLSKGGTNTPDNVVLTLAHINTKKGSLTPYSWAGKLAQRGIRHKSVYQFNMPVQLSLFSTQHFNNFKYDKSDDKQLTNAL